MPGLVPSAGITIDERIRNLMDDRGHPDLVIDAADEHLADKALLLLRRLDREREAIVADIGRAVPRHLELMGRMGIELVDEIARVYPAFPRRAVPRSWEHYLPPLPSELARLLECYA